MGEPGAKWGREVGDTKAMRAESREGSGRIGMHLRERARGREGLREQTWAAVWGCRAEGELRERRLGEAVGAEGLGEAGTRRFPHRCPRLADP